MTALVFLQVLLFLQVHPRQCGAKSKKGKMNSHDHNIRTSVEERDEERDDGQMRMAQSLTATL
jgi:hypothetical protein